MRFALNRKATTDWAKAYHQPGLTDSRSIKRQRDLTICPQTQIVTREQKVSPAAPNDTALFDTMPFLTPDLLTPDLISAELTGTKGHYTLLLMSTSNVWLGFDDTY